MSGHFNGFLRRTITAENQQTIMNIEPDRTEEGSSEPDMTEEGSSDFKFKLEGIISRTLNFDKSSVAAIVSHLSDKIGLESEQDLPFLREEDLLQVGFLKPIQIRKLFSSFKELETETGSFNVMPISCNPVTEIEINPTRKEWTDNICIPWESFPPLFLIHCKNGVRPQTKDMRSVITTIFNMISEIESNPGRSNLRSIASKMVSVYPKALGDCTDDGELISCGTYGIVRLLEHRFDSFKRKKKVRSQPLIDTRNEEQTTCTKRKRVADKYGCVRWNPEDSPFETAATQKRKIGWLQSEYEKQYRDVQKVSKFMLDTYPQQRRDINSGMPVAEVLKIWPFLLEPDFLFEHFNHLVGFPISLLSEQIELKGDKLINFFAFLVTDPKYYACPLKTRLESLKDELQSNERLLTIIPLLMAHFREKEEDLVCVYEDVNEKSVILNNVEHPVHPCISIFGTSVASNNFMVSLDHVSILETTIWNKAVEALLTVYFVFNIPYPNQCSLTLEFIQRCFMKLNPKKGRKTFLKNNFPKVQRLINQLRDFENVWVLQGLNLPRNSSYTLA